MTSELEEKVLEKLDQILKVLALQIAADRTVSERVHLLRIAGLDYRTIADVLETKVETVRVLASQFKAKRRK
jgi:DNA-directed RNA polymerase specialized sigma24 family protein